MTEMGIVSTGTWFPETYVTAEEIARQSGLPEWVVREKLGIERKFVADPDVHPNEMAVKAARKAIDRAHIARGDARVHTIKLADLIEGEPAPVVRFALYQHLSGEVEVVCKGHFFLTFPGDGQAMGHQVYLSVLQDLEHLIQVPGHPQFKV